MKALSKALRLALCAVILACAAALAPASAQDEVDPDALAAAVELVEAANMDAMFDTVLPLFGKQIVDLVLKVKPELKGKVEPLVDEFLTTALSDGRAEFMQEMAKLYARRLTVEELNDVTAFYRTPTGKRLVAILPDLQVEASEIGQQWGGKIAQQTFEKLRAKLKEQGHEF